MIIGTFLSYIKSYSGTHFIPLSSGAPISGLLGPNGIGKSAVLEALDSVFNNRDFILNHTGIKRGKEATFYCSPVWLIKKDGDITFQSAELACIKAMSEILWSWSNKNNYTFIEHKEKLIKAGYSPEEYYLISIGRGFDRNNNKTYISLGIIKDDEVLFKEDEVNKNNIDKIKEKILNTLIDNYTYIYIPKEIEHKQFAKLENVQIQKLLGQELRSIIKDQIKESQVNDINKSIQNRLDELNTSLVDYTFTSEENKKNKKITKNHIYNLIIERIISNQTLSKNVNGKNIPINGLSSGEQQRAIIDLISQLLQQNIRADGIILAIDEPEVSLHVSACYEQFEKLYKMSNHCNQILFTSHWYGFIPTLENCALTLITASQEVKSKETKAKCYFTDSSNYREDIKNWARKEGQEKAKQPRKNKDTKMEDSNDMSLPIIPMEEVIFKGLNDLTQSIIISSVYKNDPYNWLICEGSSDKIYLEKYLSKDIPNLKIVAVGGCENIRRIFTIVQSFLCNGSQDSSQLIPRSKIFFLTDTDNQCYKPTKSSIKNCHWFRLVFDDDQDFLVTADSNITSPLDMEGALNLKLLLNALTKMDDLPLGVEEIINRFKNETTSTYLNETLIASELNPREKQSLTTYLKSDIHKKVDVAKQYIEQDDFESYPPPQWIEKLKSKFLAQ